MLIFESKQSRFVEKDPVKNVWKLINQPMAMAAEILIKKIFYALLCELEKMLS